MENNLQPKWYVIYTRPRYERKIHAEVSTMKGYESYLPLRKIIRKWGEALKLSQEPMFPNYIFVKSTASNRVVLFDVPGVVHFVAFEGKAVTIAQAEIDKIKLLESCGNELEREPYGAAGSPVMIRKGIFAGIKGILYRKLNNTRLVVHMPLLKQAVSVNVAEEDLLLI